MTATDTGWQPDGSYLPCPECHWEPPKERRRPAPGRPIRLPGTTHYSDCPTVPDLSLSPELQQKLAEMSRARRRAEVESRNFFIG